MTPADHSYSPLTGQTLDYTRFATSRRGPPGGFGSGPPPSRTPGVHDFSNSGSRTPLGAGISSNLGSRTPAWGGAAASGGRTPAWSANASSSSRTPAWQQPSGSGGRTPAWSSNDGSRTVNPYADGSRTQYGGSGNRTPAWNPTATTSSYSVDPFSGAGGGRTPAYVASGSTGHTPAAMGQTPKFSGDAPTPFASGLPETPGYSGAVGDGPRYEEGTPSP